MEYPLLRLLQNKISYDSNKNTGTGPKGSPDGEMLSPGHCFILLCVKFVVNEGPVTIPPLLHANLLPPPHDVCGSPDQAADYSMRST